MQSSDMKNPRYLYRGVNLDLHRKMQGELQPKSVGERFERGVYYGEDVYYGGGATYGKSQQNAVIMHQQDSAKYLTSGVSTTPIYENAVTYATHRGEYSSGVVYKIDTKLLGLYGVTAYRVSEYAANPAIPEDDEVILVASNGGFLPKEIIVEVVDVYLHNE